MTSEADSKTGGKPQPAPSREERLAAALRQNLRRRKAAAKDSAPWAVKNDQDPHD